MQSLLARLFAVPVPPRPPVPPTKTRICVAGYGLSHNTGRAQRLAAAIAAAHPSRYETWFYFSTFCYRDFLESIKTEIPEEQKSLPSTLDTGAPSMVQHRSAPFVWFERAAAPQFQAVGGRDKFCDWSRTEFAHQEDIQAWTSLEEPPLTELFFDNATPGGTWMGGGGAK